MASVTRGDAGAATLPALDEGTRQLVRIAAVVAVGSEADVRAALADAADEVQPEWVEEVILQSYLFAGFPRALNAAREWRRVSGRPAPADDADAETTTEEWRARGERTCAVVYGRFYEPLRRNIRELHPALDSWMIVDGYGKVLSRPGLDLRRRELCVVAACAASRQDRQLHSHLHGALHAGASSADLSETLDIVADLAGPEDARRYRQLLARVLGK
ncbi:MAG: carboxymuconolactone decarboxylase family protein [Gemmatimonadaceae bacterium]